MPVLRKRGSGDAIPTVVSANGALMTLPRLWAQMVGRGCRPAHLGRPRRENAAPVLQMGRDDEEG